jgi:hypothetical protein
MGLAGPNAERGTGHSTEDETVRVCGAIPEARLESQEGLVLSPRSFAALTQAT